MEIALRVHVVQCITSNMSGHTRPIFAIFSPYESALRADDGSLPYFPISQGTLPWQPNHLWTSGITQPKKTGVFCQIFPDILDRFSQSFHHMKALYIQMMALYFSSKFGQLPSSNLGVYAVKTCNFCRCVFTWFDVFRRISPDVLDLFSQSFHHMKALYVQMTALYFSSKFGQLPSSNLGVYLQFLPPCTRNFRTIFIRHVGVSKWLEDRNFDFSRVIGKHFCTTYRNLVRFGSVTPEFKT